MHGEGELGHDRVVGGSGEGAREYKRHMAVPQHAYAPKNEISIFTSVIKRIGRSIFKADKIETSYVTKHCFWN